MVRGIFEIQLVTGQLAPMERFYRTVVGLPELFRDDGRGRVHLGLGTGQLILAEAGGEEVLADWPGVPPRIYRAEDTPVAGPRGHGPLHFAFHVDDEEWCRIGSALAGEGDAEAAAGGGEGEAVTGAGGDTTASSVTRGPLVWGSGMQSLYFRDPDGNCVELICEVARD